MLNNNTKKDIKYIERNFPQPLELNILNKNSNCIYIDDIKIMKEVY